MSLNQRIERRVEIYGANDRRGGQCSAMRSIAMREAHMLHPLLCYTFGDGLWRLYVRQLLLW